MTNNNGNNRRQTNNRKSNEIRRKKVLLNNKRNELKKIGNENLYLITHIRDGHIHLENYLENKLIIPKNERPNSKIGEIVTIKQEIKVINNAQVSLAKNNFNYRTTKNNLGTGALFNQKSKPYNYRTNKGNNGFGSILVNGNILFPWPPAIMTIEFLFFL